MFLLDIIAWRDAITGDAKAGVHKAGLQMVLDDYGVSPPTLYILG